MTCIFCLRFVERFHFSRAHIIHAHATPMLLNAGAPKALLVMAIRRARSLDSEPEQVANMTASAGGMVATRASA